MGLSHISTISDTSVIWVSCSFTGKERDIETGFGYFGARYYDPTILTSWTAVDPMSDKYPGISPYAYCAWNPMKLVDPDGEEVINAHTSKIAYLSQKIASLQSRLSNCTTKRQNRRIQRQINRSNKQLTEQKEMESMVNTAIQDLKEYGNGEFEKLDNLKDRQGNSVDAYISMEVNLRDKAGKILLGSMAMDLNSYGTVSSKYGKNTVHISINTLCKSNPGKTLAHEGGHAIYEVQFPNAVQAFYKETGTTPNGGHEPGNPSGNYADECENKFVENQNKR